MDALLSLIPEDLKPQLLHAPVACLASQRTHPAAEASNAGSPEN